MLYDRSGSPVHGARVTFVEGVYSVSDRDGRFAVPSIPFSGIIVEKEGYETYRASPGPVSDAEALYVTIASVANLEDLAAEALRRKSWAEAESCVGRALAAKPEAPFARYLKALILALPDRQGRNADEALALVRALAEEGFPVPAVLLLSADILERDFGDPEGALSFLEAWMPSRSDPDVEARVGRLLAELGQGEEKGSRSKPP